MVNINIELPPELHKRAKIRAAMRSQTLKELLIETLERSLPRDEVRR